MNITVKSITVLLIINIQVLLVTQGIAQLINRATIINSDNGLSQNSVYAICKDSKGFLWVGTGDGLNRYDGKEFINFTNTFQQSPHTLKGFLISYTMQEDNLHNLWFSTDRNLVKYNQVSQTFEEIIPTYNFHYDEGNKLIAAIDTLKNTIWFYSANICLYSYNYVKNRFHHFDFPSTKGQQYLFNNPSSTPDHNGNIWFTSTDGLFCFNKKNSSWSQLIKGYYFRHICRGSEGKLWLLTHQDLFSFDTRSHILKKYKNDSLQTDKFISIATDINGRVWCGTNKGNLYYCSEPSKELSFAGNINKISGIQNILELRCLYIDQSNLLWIGTEGGGVIQLDLNPRNFNNFPSSQNDTQNSLYIKSIFCDNDGKVWMGTFKKGIYILDPETRKAVKFQIPKNKVLLKNDENIFSINKDANGIYWFGYNGVLVAYNKKENQFYFHQVPLNFPNTYLTINQIRISKGGLLLSTTTGLFEVITSPRGDKTLFKQILNTAVAESFMTPEGALWASSLYIGLIKINTDSVDSYTNHLRDNGFRCLTEDTSHQILWVASQKGLLAYHLPTGKYKYYTEENGLLNGYLYGIIETGNEIWMSSNKGLAKGIITYKNGNTFPEIAFKCYTKDDGLQSDEFNTGAYAIAKDGTIYFGGINGLNWFKPEKVYTNKLKPSVAIIGLEINDTAFFKSSSPEYLQTLTILFKNNTFTIKFIGLEFSNPQGIHYRFKMEGLENGWSTEKHSREVRYANLPPGKYIFRLAAANSDDVWSDEVRLSISILPPFYSTWWFRLIIIVILLSAVIFVTQKISRFKLKKKIRQLEKQKALEDERNRISKEMHDDLGAGLTQISLISEAAKRRNKAGRFPGDELNDISKTSKQLIENVSEIIWAMNPEFDTLSSMIAYLREQLSKLLEYSGKQYYIQLPEVYTDMNIANSKRKNISMLLKEAVNNAIKHSNATSIYVKIVLINDHLQIEIKDNGQGFDVNNVSTGNGIKNYAFRTGLLNGISNVISDNSGTEVYFRIPLLD